MKYPKFLKNNDTIYLIAPSLGTTVDPYKSRQEKGIEYFKSLGYKIKEGNNIHSMGKCESAPAILRAKEFMDAWKSEASLIWSVTGGEIMIDMLEYIDFDLIKNSIPKLFAGFSDNTNLSLILATNFDIASIYGIHISNFGVKKLHQQNYDFISLITGNNFEFEGYDKYQRNDLKYEDTFAPLNLEFDTKYQSLSNHDESFKGRIIGGCIDVMQCLCGTKYDKLVEFEEKYKDDGIILFFDSCDFTSTGLYRALKQFEYAGYYRYLKGIIIGRVYNQTEVLGFEFIDAITKGLKHLNIPVIYDGDIGHVPPVIPILNGSIANVSLTNGKFKIKFEKK